VSIKFRKQSAGAVPIPEAAYVQLFVDVDGQPKVKDNAGQVTALAQASTLTLAEQITAPIHEPDKLKLYARDDAGITELFIKDSSGNEIQVTKDGELAGASGGLMPHPGLFGNPAIGEFAAGHQSDLITLPAGATPGDRAGVFAVGAIEVRAPSGQQLLWGTAVATGPTPITLKAGAYAEWVFCELEPGVFGWLPAGASNEEPPTPPLAYRPPGPDPAMPNEWVLSSEHDDEVNFPVAPLHGDSFAVFVDGEGCDLIPGTGADLYSPNGTNVVTGPTALTVPGSSYYEWIWNDNAQQWYPRQNILSLHSDAVLDAILSAPTSVINFGNRWLGAVMSPNNPDEVATKGYVDGLVPYSKTLILDSHTILGTSGGGTVPFFTFPIPFPLTEYAFEFHLTINQATAPAFVGVGLNADSLFYTQNITLVRIAAVGPPVVYAVTYGTQTNQGQNVIDDAARQPGNTEAIITGGFRSSNATFPGPVVLRAFGTAGQTSILAGSWGRVWRS